MKRHVLTEIEQQIGRENRNASSFRAMQRKGRRASAKIRKERGDTYFFPDEAAAGRAKGGETTRKLWAAKRQRRGMATCANPKCRKQFWPRGAHSKRPQKTCSRSCAGACRAPRSLEQFGAAGRRGGPAAARAMSARARTERARKAGLARAAKARGGSHAGG